MERSMPVGPRVPSVVAALAACVALGLQASPPAEAAQKSPRAKDRDGDHLPDRWERRYRISTKRPSGRRDPDRDGLTNRREFRLRLNPRRRDTDQDGVSDGAELRLGSDPRKAERSRRSDVSPSSTQAGGTAPSGDAGSVPEPGPAAPEPPVVIVPTPYHVAPQDTACNDAYAVEEVSEDTPWCTIQRGMTAAPAEELVYVHTGTYRPFTATGTRDGTVTIRPYPREAVSLAGFTLKVPGVRVAGFKITGTGTIDASDVQLLDNSWKTDGSTGGMNIDIRPGTHDVLIEGNRLSQGEGFWGANIINLSSTDTWAPISDVTIRRNLIGPLPSGGDAIHTAHTVRLRIEDNEIFGLSFPPGKGMHPDVFQALYGSDGTVFSRNFVHDITAQGVNLQPYMGTHRNFVAEDNVMIRIVAPWQGFGFAAEGAYVAHNTLDGPVFVGGTGITLLANAVDQAMIFDSGPQMDLEAHNVATRFSSLTPGIGSIVARPIFRDVAHDDVSLVPGTPGWHAAPDGTDLGTRVPPQKMPR